MSSQALLEDRWTPSRVAAYLGVTKDTLRKWRAQGKGPKYHKYGESKQAPTSYDPVSVRRFARETLITPSNEREIGGENGPN